MDKSVSLEDRLAALMRDAQDDHAAAYTELLTAVSSVVQRNLRRRLRWLQTADIEDLVQDVLLSLHAVRATYDPARPFLPWLMAITRSRVADGARRYARRTAHEITVEELPETFSDDAANSPGEGYGDREALQQALQDLPQGQRLAIEMLKLRELSLKEAAALTGKRTGALKTAVHRGIDALRKVLTVETRT